MTRQESIEKLRELIDGIEIAMLTTVEADGSLRSRPMDTQRVDFDGTLWFLTSASSPKVQEIGRDQHVNVSFSNPEEQHYVSMSGTAELVRDRERIDEFWNPAHKAWFPGGKDDPDVALLKVHVEKAEYWDSPSNPVSHLISLASTLLTGEPANPGENEKVRLTDAKV